jgi:hypothetical protein
MTFYVGLDLGQSADYTALSIVQDVKEIQVVKEMNSPATGKPSGKPERRLHLRHLERYPLRTPYTVIAEKVAALMRDPHLSPDVLDPATRRRARKHPRLAVDATGVGRAVTDLLVTKGLRFTSVTITGGDKAHRAAGTWRVPKRDLVAALEVPFHAGTLKVAEGLALWPTLREELMNFRRKINLKTAHDSYEHWRESDHDDLVLATALACGDMTRPGNRALRVIQ